MELPKNITQIGEADRHCKIYVEDYVISYIRQMNHQAADKKEALALYGRRQEEGEIAYLFIYGACRMTTLSGQVRHLSQAQLQEAEKQKRLYFPEDMFLGYSLLNGEMVEGFYILEQGICRYVAGYACFYEKNDSMLAYMLDSRKEEAKPEQIDNEKYERVRQRQEETRQQYRQQTGRQDAGKQTDRDSSRWTAGEADRRADSKWQSVDETGREQSAQKNRQQDERSREPSGLRRMRRSAAAMFVLLCAAGAFSLNQNGELKEKAQQVWNDFTEKKLQDNIVDAITGSVQNPSQNNNTLIAEDRLTQAIQEENRAASGTQSSETSPQETQETQPSEMTQETQEASASEDGSQQETSGTAQPEADSSQQSAALEETGQPENPEAGQPSASESTSAQPVLQPAVPAQYVIQKGDTLIAISIRFYGSDRMVKAICEKNNITDPDDIYFGKTIWLP